MGDVSREMETKNQKEILGIKSTVKGMKMTVGRLIIRHNIVQKSISDLKISQQELNKLKCIDKKREKKRDKTNESIQELWYNFKRCNMHLIRITEEERT